MPGMPSLSRLSIWTSLWLTLLPSLALADGPTDAPDKGGTRLEALTLPTGPGSLAGMGEQVSAEPATGALTLSIPIELPPAPAGVQPDLTLRYDSRAGNGPVGIGWSIAPLNIQRRTNLGLPRYDATDELLWAGQRLVEVEPGTYRLRVEGEFTRVVALPAGFRADRKDGTKITLGTTRSSQVVDGDRVFRWLPDHVVSVHGDTADYLYAANGSERSLSEIDLARPGAPPSRVVFQYQARPDRLPDARAGFLVTTTQRLAEIDTFVDGSPGRAVRSVKLSYDDSSGLSRLSGVQACAADGSVCLPAVVITVSQPSFASAATQSLAPPGVWLGDPDAALVDVDGDSLPDIVKVTSSGSTWWRNLGPAGFAAGQPVRDNPGVDLSSTGAALQDMNGDGHAELFFWLGSAGEDGAVYAPFSASGGTTSFDPTVSLSGSQGLPPNGPDVRWLDLDGDGRVDALQATPDGWTAWFNLGGGQLSAPVELSPPEVGLSFEDPTLRLADMNGDGLVDLVRMQSGTARVFLNLGFGVFAPGQDLLGPPDVGGDDLRLYLGDADGDGLADVFYVAPGRLSIWSNLGGQAFGPEIDVAGAPDYDPLTTTVRIADLLGHGVRGIVYSGAIGGAPFLWFLDPTSDTRPNLVTGIDNGVGGSRRVQFESSGDLLATAAAQGAPFASVIPFPISVVTSLVQADGVSPDQHEQHGYRDPYYDPAERLFEGFATAETIAPGDVNAAGLDTRLTVHTGENEDLSLAGKISLSEFRQLDGTLLRRLRTTWVAEPIATGLAGDPVAFAAAVADDAEEWEGATAAKTRRTRRQFDVHANLVEEDDDGWIGPTADPEAATIRASYAEDEAPWILGKLAEREVLNATGARTSDERVFYDGTALEGLAAGQLELGDEMRRSAWISGATFVDVRRTERDAFGNAIAWLDADGRRTEVDYEMTRHQFPTQERHFPGQGAVLSFNLNLDPATGNLLTYVEPDGAVTRYSWDGLGRLASIERPTDPPGDPSEKLDYVLTAADRSLTRSRRSEPGRTFDVIAVDLFDGLLRPAAHAQSAEQAGQLAVSDRVERDARGGVARQCGAYFAAAANAPCSADAGVTEDFHDSLGRLVRRVLPTGGELLWVPGPGTLDAYDAAASQGQAEATRTFLDWRGQPGIVQLDPGGAQQRQFAFERDPAGKVIERTSPLGDKVTAAYDGLGRLVTLGDPDTGTISNQYDGAGHSLSRVDARGEQLVWAYDGAGRVLSESDQQGPRAQYCYDDPVLCGAGSNSPGRLLRVADRSGSTAFGYDLDDRMTTETVMQGGRALESSFEFDAADRLTRLHYPDGTSLDFGYGGRALVTSIPTLLSQATYSPGGLPLTRSFANGATVDVTRDIAGRAIGVTASLDGATIVGTLYSLSASGAPISRVDLSGTTAFALDDAERLTQEAGPFGTRLEAFDGDDRLLGRWAVPSDARLPGQGLTYGQEAGPHALSASARGSISYDASGNRVSEGGLDLSWDAAGELVGVESTAASAQYIYGFDGSRRSRVVAFADGGSEADFGFGDLVEVRDGVLWKHVVIQGERIASFLGDVPTDTSP